MSSFDSEGREIITIDGNTYLCSNLYTTGTDGTGWEIRLRNNNTLITKTGIKIKELGSL